MLLNSGIHVQQLPKTKHVEGTYTWYRHTWEMAVVRIRTRQWKETQHCQVIEVYYFSSLLATAMYVWPTVSVDAQ